MADNDNHG